MQRAHLSKPTQQVIERCQRINFGRIVFRVRNGEPDPTQPWRTLRSVKIASGENLPRPEALHADFKLCKEQVALLSELSHLSDGTQVTVEIKHGLPFLLEIEQDHQAA
ncbi:MAG: hypothetical protein KF768_05440 [Phycisphaeraceae bacterium]|nr:hypothetical protein [Phycisphaeraceae bacterium]